MHLPFTASQFVAVFTAYNHAVWPAAVVAYALAIGSLVLVARRSPLADRFAGLSLAALWAFTGVVYQIAFFSRINPAARVFGALFVVQAVLLAAATLRGRVNFRFSYRDGRSRVGHVMIAFSMVLYPLVGYVAGHGFPNGPVFGITPCPLVIFTFGMLLNTERTLPKYLAIVPLMWALVGASAAFSLGIREDTGLLVCGLLGSALILSRRAAAPSTAETPARTRGLRALLHVR